MTTTRRSLWRVGGFLLRKETNCTHTSGCWLISDRVLKSHGQSTFFLFVCGWSCWVVVAPAFGKIAGGEINRYPCLVSTFINDEKSRCVYNWVWFSFLKAIIWLNFEKVTCGFSYGRELEEKNGGKFTHFNNIFFLSILGTLFLSFFLVSSVNLKFMIFWSRAYFYGLVDFSSKTCLKKEIFLFIVIIIKNPPFHHCHLFLFDCTKDFIVSLLYDDIFISGWGNIFYKK